MLYLTCSSSSIWPSCAKSSKHTTASHGLTIHALPLPYSHNAAAVKFKKYSWTDLLFTVLYSGLDACLVPPSLKEAVFVCCVFLLRFGIRCTAQKTLEAQLWRARPFSSIRQGWLLWEMAGSREFCYHKPWRLLDVSCPVLALANEGRDDTSLEDFVTIASKSSYLYLVWLWIYCRR